MNETAKRKSPFHFDMLEVVAGLQVIAALMLITGLIVTLTSGLASQSAGFEDRESGTPLLQFLVLAGYLPAALFMIARPDLPLRIFKQAWVYFALILLAIVSVSWAVEPATSFRRLIALLVATVFFIHVATWYTPRRFLLLLAGFASAVTVLSAVSVVIPGVGITSDGVHSGTMRGIFFMKNIFGDFEALAIITMGVVAMIIRDPRYRLALIGLSALAFVELLLSDSRTPLIGLVLSAAAMIAANFLYRPSRWQRSFTQGVRNGIVGLGILFAGVIMPLVGALTLSALGRDMTLSGRTHLWEYAIGKGIDRPWLGVGYKSFWTDSVTFDLRTLHDHWSTGEGTKALTANAHNGFLEVWLDLGFVGLSLLLLLFAVAAFKANRQLQRTLDPVYIWHIGAITYVASYYLTESGVLQQNTTSWFVFSYAFLSICAQEIRDKKTSRVKTPSRRKQIARPQEAGLLATDGPATYS